MKKLRWLKKRAMESLQELNRIKKDSRYQKVIGRLIHEKLLIHDHILPRRDLVTLEELLWVGKYEPRVLELLPALLLKRPHLILITGSLPENLKKVILEIKKGKAETPFQGIMPHQYAPWIDRVGRRGKYPGLLKTYRFNQDDLKLLAQLKTRWGGKEISIIRKALMIASKD